MHMVLWNVWVNGDDRDECWGDMDDNGDGDKDDGDIDGDGKWKISTILADYFQTENGTVNNPTTYGYR